MKLKKFPVPVTRRDRQEAREVLESMSGRPGAKPFSGRLVYGAKSIRALRASLGLTQKAFARLLMVVPGAVESWEQGRRVPDTGRMALIHLLHQHPKTFRAWLEDTAEALVPQGARG